MKTSKNIKVLFVAGFGPIVCDPVASRKFYSEKLGLSFKEDSNGYMHTAGLDGVKHFALWPLAQAAQSCFGTDQWPANLPVPQAWLEFDVENIEKATAELKSQGYEILVALRKEPWGQIVTRLLGPEGLLVGMTHTPSLRPGTLEQ
jgi:catechol 2,3-dioxygenase-like lactoylglutathione lyase family enzyme